MIHWDGTDGASRQTGTAALNKSWSVSAREGDAAKMSRVICGECEETVSEVWRAGVRVCCVCACACVWGCV